MVLLAAIPCIMPTPAISAVTIESQNQCESPKPIRPMLKMTAAMGMPRMRPRTFLRAASDKADASAPTPIAPIRNPSVCGPPCSTWAAKMGISTTHGHAHQAHDGKQHQDGADGENPVT